MLKYIKNKKLRRLIKKMFIASIIILVLIVVLVIVASLLRTSYRKLYKVGENKTFEKSYNILFNEINIDTKMTDIYIKESTDNIVKIITYGEEKYIDVKEKNNKLFITINDKNLIGLDLYSCISKIELHLPSNYNKVIRINSNFGNIKINKFIDATLNINNKFGDISVDEIHYIKIKSKEGNINIDTLNIARIDNKNGDIKLNTVSDLEIQQKYGNLTIENVEKYLNLDVESGNIKINNIVLEKDSYIDSKYSDVKISSINDIYVDAKTDHGKIKVSKNDKESKIKLKIRNYNGDIKVN